jgi:CD109 antigen
MKNLEFYGEQKLTYLEKRFSIFIQTDKALYKSDDLIHFRVFAINPNSLPYSVQGNAEVTIKDPTGNKIKQLSNITFVKGKYESELLLSSSPPLGSWSIVADIEGEVNRAA